MGKDFRVLTTPTENKRLNAALFGSETFETMLPGWSDVPEPTLIWRRQADLAEQERPFVTAIALRSVCDQNSHRGTFEKVDVILLNAVRAGLDQGGVEALTPKMRCWQRKLREEARRDQCICALQENTKIFV